MAATTPRGFPYPEDSDPLDVAGDIEALALAVDMYLGPLDERLTSLETFRTDLIVALQAVLDPGNPADAASLSSLAEGPT